MYTVNGIFATLPSRKWRCKTRKKQKIGFFHLHFFKGSLYYRIRNGHGVLAQLARAPHWQCGGQEFKSPILHHILSSNQDPDFFLPILPDSFRFSLFIQKIPHFCHIFCHIIFLTLDRLSNTCNLKMRSYY